MSCFPGRGEGGVEAVLKEHVWEVRGEVWAGCPWLSSHRAPGVLWLSSCLGYGVVLFTLSGVGLLGLLLVSLILGIFFQEGLVDRQVGSLREVTFIELPIVMVRGKFIVHGLLCDDGDAASASSCNFGLLRLVGFLSLFLHRSCCCLLVSRCLSRRSRR